MQRTLDSHFHNKTCICIAWRIKVNIYEFCKGEGAVRNYLTVLFLYIDHPDSVAEGNGGNSEKVGTGQMQGWTGGTGGKERANKRGTRKIGGRQKEKHGPQILERGCPYEISHTLLRILNDAFDDVDRWIAINFGALSARFGLCHTGTQIRSSSVLVPRFIIRVSCAGA